MTSDTKDATPAVRETQPEAAVRERHPLLRILRGLAFAVSAGLPIGLVAMVLGLMSPILGLFGLVFFVAAVLTFLIGGYEGETFGSVIRGMVGSAPSSQPPAPPGKSAPAVAQHAAPIPGQPAPSAPETLPVLAVANGYAWTPTVFSKEWGFDGTTMIKKQGPAGSAVRSFFGFIFYGLALLPLLIGLWPVTLIAALIGFSCMPKTGIVGAWVGDCPTCCDAIVFADPAMSAALTPMQRLCPLCTAPIEIVRDRFIAIPGTGAPSASGLLKS
jgi:hypothetical protein